MEEKRRGKYHTKKNRQTHARSKKCIKFAKAIIDQKVLNLFMHIFNLGTTENNTFVVFLRALPLHIERECINCDKALHFFDYLKFYGFTNSVCAFKIISVVVVGFAVNLLGCMHFASVILRSLTTFYWNIEF